MEVEEGDSREESEGKIEIEGQESEGKREMEGRENEGGGDVKRVRIMTESGEEEEKKKENGHEEDEKMDAEMTEEVEEEKPKTEAEDSAIKPDWNDDDDAAAAAGVSLSATPFHRIPASLSASKMDLAAHVICLHLARQRLPAFEGEAFLLPAVKAVFEVICGGEAPSILEGLSLGGREGVRGRIVQMAGDVRAQMGRRARGSPLFALFLDEVSVPGGEVEQREGEVRVVCFVRYIEEEEEEAEGVRRRFGEDVFLCRPVPRSGTGFVAGLVANEVRSLGLDWKRCVDVCSDPTAPLTRGAVAELQALNPGGMTATSCLLHREGLVSASLSCSASVPPSAPLSLLSAALPIAVRIMNRVKHLSLRPDLCYALAADYPIGSKERALFLRSETRWLVRGHALRHLIDHRDDVLHVLLGMEAKDANLAAYVRDGAWLLSIAYLADLFDHVNALLCPRPPNQEDEGEQAASDILAMRARVLAFRRKVVAWGGRVALGVTEMFPTLSDCRRAFPKEWDNVRKVVCAHLPQVAAFLQAHFPVSDDKEEGDDGLDWVRNPFAADSESQQTLSSNEKDELIELSSDRSLALEFGRAGCGLEAFWLARKAKFPLLWRKATATLLPFSSTRLAHRCTATIFALADTLWGLDRFRLEDYLVLCHAGMDPDLNKLVASSGRRGFAGFRAVKSGV